MVAPEVLEHLEMQLAAVVVVQVALVAPAQLLPVHLHRQAVRAVLVDLQALPARLLFMLPAAAAALMEHPIPQTVLRALHLEILELVVVLSVVQVVPKQTPQTRVTMEIEAMALVEL